MQRVRNEQLGREVWQISLLDGLIVIQLNDDKKSGWVEPMPGQANERARMAAYLALCHVCHGVDIEAPEYVAGLDNYVDSEQALPVD